MKKVLKILGILIGLFILLIILLPVFFKGKIFDMVMEEANKNLTAKVEIEDLSLSLIRNFPNFSLTIDRISVAGTEEFEGVKLADIEQISASLDVMSVISGDRIKINSFGITKPVFHVVVTREGKANWDIVKADEMPAEEEAPTEETDEEESGPLNISVKEYFIRNADIIYDDREGNMYAEIKNLTHEGKGDFDLDEFLFETMTTIDAITYKMDGMTYLKEVNTELKADLNMNLPEGKYTFLENYLRMNEFKLSFDGWFQMISGDEYDMDLTFGADDTEFKSLLSLVPNAYTADFADVQADGSLKFNGTAKGKYKYENEVMTLPGFDLTLKVPHARIQYPDLPESIDNIEIDINTRNPGGSEDNTIIDINTFYMELAKNPIDFNLHMKTPVSDPDIAGGIHAQIDMESLKNAMPVEEGESYTGTVTADIDFGGKMSALEEERYGDFRAEGKLIILDFLYESPDFSYPVKLKKMYMDFSPQFVDMSTFEALVGESDIKADGRIDNMLAYYFNDEVLTGKFNMQSRYMNLNEFMTEEEEAPAGESKPEGESAPADTAYGVFEVPGNIDFTLNTDIEKMIYEDMEIDNVKGTVRIYEQKADMSNLSMNMLDGSIVMSGSYNTINPERPGVDFKLDMSKIDIQKTGETFNTIKQMAPIVESSTGKISAKFNMKGEMDNKMDMDLNSLNGGGSLKTHGVVIDNETLEKLDNAIKTDKFNPLTLNDINIKFTFADGRVTTEPFTVKAGGIANTISGHTTFEQTIDYIVVSEVPSSILGGQVNQLAGSLLSGLKDRGIDAGDALPDIIKVNFAITGDIHSPDVKPTFGGGEGKSTKDRVKEEVKERVKEEIEKKKEEVKEKGREKAEQIIADAQKRADQIKAEAENQADKVRSEGKSAADKIRSEADKQAQRLIDEAGNPLSKKAAEKAGDKLKKEAEEKAQQTERESENKAQQIEAEAQKRADGIMKKAREEADAL